MKAIPFFSSLVGIALVLPVWRPVGAEEPGTPALGGVWRLNRELSENPGRKLMESMRGQAEPGGRGGRGAGGGMGPGGGMGGGGRGGGMGGGGMQGGGGGGRGGAGMAGPRGRGEPGGGFAADEPPLDGTPSFDRPDGSGPGGDPERGRERGGPEGERRPGRGPAGLTPSPEFRIEQEGANLAFRTENNLRLLHADGEKRKRRSGVGEREITARYLKGSLVIESKGEPGPKRKETYTVREDKLLQIDFEISGSGRMPGLKFQLVYDPVEPGGAPPSDKLPPLHETLVGR